MRRLPIVLSSALLALSLFGGSAARAFTIAPDDQGFCRMPALVWKGEGDGTINPSLDLVLGWRQDTGEGHVDLRFLFSRRADEPEAVSAWIAGEGFDSRDFDVAVSAVPYDLSTFRRAHLRLLSADPDLTRRLARALIEGQEIRAGVRHADGSLALGVFPPLRPRLRRAFQDCLDGTVDYGGRGSTG